MTDRLENQTASDERKSATVTPLTGVSARRQRRARKEIDVTVNRDDDAAQDGANVDKANVAQQKTNRAAKLKTKDELPLFNRELSWLEFNRRVLEEALDEAQPLLERLKFISIFSTNLDEFFMIRVSGLKQQVAEGIAERSPDGLTASEQLAAINLRLRPMVEAQMRCLREDVLPRLEREAIKIVAYEDLSNDERGRVDDYFMQSVFPVLTPQAVDPSHRFPYISNLSLNLGVMVDDLTDDEEPRFARIKVPPIVERLIALDETRFVLLEQVIVANINALFPGVTVGKPFVFRVTRDADIDIEEDEADDLLRMMEAELRKRRFGMAVRLEVESDMPPEMVAFLSRALSVPLEEVFVINGVLAVGDLMTLYKTNRADLKDEPFTASVTESLALSETIFDTIKRGDILLHHPFDSFDMVANFIRRAAHDPQVLAIKMTLYRTGKDSPIVRALMEASEQGKQVAVLVELKARFDEENNIVWARQLDRAGVHVVYGMLGLKTHSKLALVVRREGQGLKRYCHIGTGNYNPVTARIYTDLGLFTADEATGADATELFNFLTGFSNQNEYRRLLVAPVQMRQRLESMVEREIENHRQGRGARIILKMNSLTDENMIASLYEASRAGVSIDLIVRGICMLKPGVEALSETITVTSIVGRFLEHSRIFYFANAGAEEILIGSADWMRRNLERRVELVTPVTDVNLKARLKEILEVQLKDTVKARRLKADGTYTRVRAKAGDAAFDSQGFFMRQAMKR